MAVDPETSRGERSFAWSPTGDGPSFVDEVGGLPILKVRGWQDLPRLRHGFLGRRGGASIGPFQSLNLSGSVDDDPIAVRGNWTSVRDALPGMRVVRMNQVHGDRVARVRNAEQPVGDADGMMTEGSGLLLSVLTADCVPILLLGRRLGIVAAVHAGWRGTLAGIAAAAIAAAERDLGARPGEWEVAMGPSIGGCCYEVDAEIGERLESRWGRMPEAWSRTGEKGQLDLREANRAILAGCGVPPSLIFAIGPCTACAHADFFSHRRSGGRAGRQLSYVGWSPK